MKANTLTPELLDRIDAYWRAANYLSVGQIYLFDNPLIRRPLTLADVKHMLLGHWGTPPGQNFIYVHLNRVIKKYDRVMIFVSGPGHGGPAVVANTYLEGTYSEVYPDISQDETGLQKLFLQFSFPGGIPSHASPECPGSIHEYGESRLFAQPSLRGRARQPRAHRCLRRRRRRGRDAATRHRVAFQQVSQPRQRRRCAADPASKRLQDRQSDDPRPLTREELEQLFRGYGWTPIFVEGDKPELMHEAMARALDTAVEQIKLVQEDARGRGNLSRPRWPMIILNSPKGWTGPKVVDGLQVEGTSRAHQVPLHPRAHPEHLELLDAWLRSYRPEELFDERGRLQPELAELSPSTSSTRCSTSTPSGWRSRRICRGGARLLR